VKARVQLRIARCSLQQPLYLLPLLLLQLLLHCAAARDEELIPAAAAAGCAGADNVQSVVLVTPTGQLVKASSRGVHQMTTLPNGALDFKEGKQLSKDDSLFWALRGGGGGTFGVAVQFGMRLVPAPAAVQTVTITWLLYDSQGEAVGCACHLLLLLLLRGIRWLNTSTAL
jgi:hypothetical protein